MAYNRLIGNIGEGIACKWLQNHGFTIIERNYNKKWGELDIIAAKDKILHFIEVKSVTDNNKPNKDIEHRPEENVHELKIRRLRRTIQTYLLEKKHSLDIEFKFHIIVVVMNNIKRLGKVTFMEDIIL